MRRFVPALMLVLALLLQITDGNTAAARQTTPELNTPVAILGPDGAEIAQISVTEVIDPFVTYDPNYSPERGYRMVVVTLTLEATGSQPFTFNPADVLLTDDGGYLAAGLYTVVPETTGITLLEAQDVAAGAPLTGSLAFQVFTAATVNGVVYRPQSDRLIPLAQLTGAPPPVGTTLTVQSNDGLDAAQITVLEVVAPFEAFDPGSPPERGNQYVLLVVRIDNIGSRHIRVDPNAFELLDTDGFVTRPSYVNRGDDPLPDLAYTDPFEPGQSVTGAIGFQVLGSATQMTVLYRPASDRFIEVAALGNNAGAGQASTENPFTIQIGAATPDADVCAGFEVWAASTNDRFDVGVEIAVALQPLEDKTVDDLLAIQQAASDFAALAAEQQAANVPDAASEFNALLVTYFTGIGQALAFFAEGLETGDPATQFVALANLGEVEQSFTTSNALALYDAAFAICLTE